MTHEYTSREPAPPAPMPALMQPVSSRMLERYLLDIENLARTNEEAALRVAASLPAIATALEDETRETSHARFVAWCADWLEPDEIRPELHGMLYDLWCLKREGTDPGVADAVPFQALRQLRLGRHARPTPAVTRPIPGMLATHEHDSDLTLCAALVHATRRWYDLRGARTHCVQLNLAQLAVLR